MKIKAKSLPMSSNTDTSSLLDASKYKETDDRRANKVRECMALLRFLSTTEAVTVSIIREPRPSNCKPASGYYHTMWGTGSITFSASLSSSLCVKQRHQAA